MMVAQQVADKHLGTATGQFAGFVAAVGTVGGAVLTAGPTVVAAVAARLAPAGPAVAKLAQQGPMIELGEGQGELVAVDQGAVIARTTDFFLSHAEFAKRAFVPDGAWVGTVGKVVGQIQTLNSQTIMGNQAAAPAQIQDLMRSIFQ